MGSERSVLLGSHFQDDIVSSFQFNPRNKQRLRASGVRK